VRYLLDTNTARYIIRGNVARVRERLVEIPLADIGISVVTEAELLFGIERRPDASKLRTAVEEFLLRVNSAPWESACARQYARLHAALEAQGEPIGNLDLMIAAHALALETILVTNDRVFRRVKGLSTEDWTKP
jgi:tRNA(fMet)-specific endonuclease VapC